MLHLVIYYETSDGKRFAIARDIPYHYNLASIAQYVDGTGITVSAMSAIKTKREALNTAIFANDNYKQQGILYAPQQRRKQAMIPKESALRILAKMEEERNAENAARNGKSWADYDYRFHEAAIAKSAGYNDRAEWMDELRRLNYNV